jgi:hypothetical protein
MNMENNMDNLTPNQSGADQAMKMDKPGKRRTINRKRGLKHNGCVPENILLSDASKVIIRKINVASRKIKFGWEAVVNELLEKQLEPHCRAILEKLENT